ncbi:trypsin-like [Ctenocephalides felis]|uniref:trypsin-like n=1 Tax=Ctenocephalides felis TaxID=7515 RepID=UPI000E6E3E1C|nr:trypsin-like [Ctenocephalides felis]
MKTYIIIFVAVYAVSAGYISNRPWARIENFNSGRIVGGQDVDIEDYGWQISFEQYGQHFCGGSIMTKSIILSAAHCFDRKVEPDDVKIRAGSSEIYNGGVLVQVDRWVIHPDYDSKEQDRDVAIVFLETPLELNGGSIRTINVIGRNVKVPNNANLTVTGWGYLQEEVHDVSETLKGVSVPKIDFSLCKLLYSTRYLLTDNMLCAGFLNGEKDSCQGDSGGPLVDDTNTLVGIVSWGDGCARPVSPGVYTQLSSPIVRDFITNQTGV